MILRRYECPAVSNYLVYYCIQNKIQFLEGSCHLPPAGNLSGHSFFGQNHWSACYGSKVSTMSQEALKSLFMFFSWPKIMLNKLWGWFLFSLLSVFKCHTIREIYIKLYNIEFILHSPFFVNLPTFKCCSLLIFSYLFLGGSNSKAF